MKKIIANKFFAIALLTILAAGIRIFFLQFEYAAGWDEINYLKLGASGAIHGWNHVLHSYWSPLYPFSIAMLGKIFPDFELAGRLVSLLFGVLLIGFYYFLVEKLFSTKIAWYSSLIIALFPMLIESSVSALTESLYIFLTVIGILIGLRALKRGSMPLAMVTGIMFSMSYLTRPEGIGSLIVFVAVALIVMIYRRIRQRSSKVHWSAICAIGCFAVMSTPYWYYLHRETGKWTLSSKGTANLYGALTAMEHKGQALNPWLLLNDDNTRLPDDDIYHTGDFLKNCQPSSLPRSFGAEHSSGFLTNSFRILKKYMKDFYQVNTAAISSVLGLPLLLLAILGLFGSSESGERLWQDLYLLSYVIFFWIIVIPIFHVTERYLLPMVPIVLIWSGRGIERLSEWLRSVMISITHAWNRKLMALIPALVIMMMIGSFIG
ncbi:MAG: glycosyltransferase family 39 protein, partial [candidate division KSB1 bacterium]|nr:glycosyltransferase family 39 protein [candidate division KSB1 bacterium]